jgi:hypothetical protein
MHLLLLKVGKPIVVEFSCFDSSPFVFQDTEINCISHGAIVVDHVLSKDAFLGSSQLANGFLGASIK